MRGGLLREVIAKGGSTVVALFRNLLISSFDATIRVKRAFINFKTRTSNDCEVMHSHAHMRPIDHAAKLNFKEKYPQALLSLIRRLTRQHFNQNNFFQNDSSFALH